jgi:hypothetical protein
MGAVGGRSPKILRPIMIFNGQVWQWHAERSEECHWQDVTRLLAWYNGVIGKSSLNTRNFVWG